jgi:hypothetical protein
MIGKTEADDRRLGARRQDGKCAET